MTLYALAAGAGPNSKEGLNRAAQGIDQMRKECSRAGDLDSLRGYVGKGGAIYFGSFYSLLPPAWGFTGRNYHPPQDAFNALLSFGYALLQKDVTTMAEVVGLDPYLGCFHALEYGRPSLILDLMEEFRPLAVDRMVLALALDGHITPQDFSFTGRKERPVALGDKLIPQVIAAYEAGLEVQVDHNPSGQLRFLRHCFELQARIYASVVVGNRREYVGLVA
ncbi:MAG: CRISPR-associated endonuclease Cas1 [Caldilineaceae bacterium]